MAARSCGLRPWPPRRAKLPKNYDVVTRESRPAIGGTPIFNMAPPTPSELSTPRPGVRRGSVPGQPISCELPALPSSVVDLVARGGAGRLNRFTSTAPARGQLSDPGPKAGVQGAGRATLGLAG